MGELKERWTGDKRASCEVPHDHNTKSNRKQVFISVHDSCSFVDQQQNAAVPKTIALLWLLNYRRSIRYALFMQKMATDMLA